VTADGGKGLLAQDKLPEIIRAGTEDFRVPSGGAGGAETFGLLCFLLHCGYGVNDPVLLLNGKAPREIVELAAQWVALADRFLEVYGNQIWAFGNTLSETDKLCLSPRQVEDWAKEHFVQLDLSPVSTLDGGFKSPETPPPVSNPIGVPAHGGAR
jgi:hypothetical protein